MQNLPVEAPHDSDKSIPILSGKSVTLFDELELGYVFFLWSPPVR